jgi:hypothetical protein
MVSHDSKTRPDQTADSLYRCRSRPTCVFAGQHSSSTLPRRPRAAICTSLLPNARPALLHVLEIAAGQVDGIADDRRHPDAELARVGREDLFAGQRRSGFGVDDVRLPPRQLTRCLAQWSRFCDPKPMTSRSITFSRVRSKSCGRGPGGREPADRGTADTEPRALHAVSRSGGSVRALGRPDGHTSRPRDVAARTPRWPQARRRRRTDDPRSAGLRGGRRRTCRPGSTPPGDPCS